MLGDVYAKCREGVCNMSIRYTLADEDDENNGGM